MCIRDSYESEALQFMFRKWEISFDTSLALLIVVGFSYSIGISFIFHAYRIASPASIAPFEYILILYAMFLGWIIWGDIIDLQSVIGSKVPGFLNSNVQPNASPTARPIKQLLCLNFINKSYHQPRGMLSLKL